MDIHRHVAFDTNASQCRLNDHKRIGIAGSKRKEN